MNRMMDVLYWIVGIACSGGALFFFVRFLQSKGPEGDKHFLWYAIGLAVVACICALLYFVRHVNKEEEIHITQ